MMNKKRYILSVLLVLLQKCTHCDTSISQNCDTPQNTLNDARSQYIYFNNASEFTKDDRFVQINSNNTSWQWKISTKSPKKIISVQSFEAQIFEEFGQFHHMIDNECPFNFIQFACTNLSTNISTRYCPLILSDSNLKEEINSVCPHPNFLFISLTLKRPFPGLHATFSLKYRILEDKLYCRRDITHINNETLHWESTAACQQISIPCPGTTGNATRFCQNIDGNVTWERPNLSGCISDAMKNLSKMADDLMDQTHVSKDAILNVTSGIVDVISAGKNKTLQLYPGDLVEATKTVVTIAEVTANVSSHGLELDEIVKGYGDAVNEIVDPGTSETWKQLTFTRVEDDMINVLNGVERLSSHIAQKKLTSLRRYKRSSYNYTVNENVVSANQFIDFSISFHEKVAICDETLDLTVGPNAKNRITLTSSVFRSAIMNTKDKYVQLYTGRFSSIPSLLSKAAEEEMKYNPRLNYTSLINSDVVSTRILNTPKTAYEDLKQPITLVFTMGNGNLTETMRQNCVAMNTTETDSRRRWYSEGCYLNKLSSNNTHAVCICSHMTNFAVLMDIFEVQGKLDHTNSQILTYITYISGGLSIVGCLITVVVFEFFRLKKERIRIHEQLAISIVLVQIFYLAGIDRTENKRPSFIGKGQSLVRMYPGGDNRLPQGNWPSFSNNVKLSQITSGTPIIIVSVSAGIFYEEYGNTTACWLSRKVLLVAFVPAVGLLILLNTVVLLTVLRIMMRSISVSAKLSSDERSNVKAGLKAAAILLPLLGLTWTLGFFSVDSKDTLIFTYLFTFLNSLQGVFFFLFHCLMSADVQTAFERRSQRRSRSSLSASVEKFNKKVKRQISADTSETDVSESNKSSPSSDHQHRRQNTLDNYGYEVDSHPNNLLIRSYSDGIPRWKNTNSFKIQTGYAPEYRPRDIIYETSKIDDDDIDALYSKPLKRHERNNPKLDNHMHVHFQDDMLITERKLGPRITYNGVNQYRPDDSHWSKTFLKEIQDKALSMKLRNNLAYES